MHTKLLTVGVAIALGAGFAIDAAAQVRPEVQVNWRISAMRLQGKYFYPLVSMAQGKAPWDGAIVARNAGYLDVLMKMPWDNFDPGTQGVKSRALPEIYTETAKWKAAQDTMSTELAKFVAAAKSGNEANTKVAILDAAKACDGCHDTFRQKQQ